MTQPIRTRQKFYKHSEPVVFMISSRFYNKIVASFAAILFFIMLTASLTLAQNGPLIFVPKEPLQTVFDGVHVASDPDVMAEDVFLSKTIAALELLKLKAPKHYADFTSFVQRIEASNRPGANLNLNVMTIGVAKRSVESSTAWLASFLAHEFVHIRKFKQTGKRYGDAHLMADKKAALQTTINEELESNRYQIDVLQLLGAQQFEIDFVKNQKGDQADVDRDGDYDTDDWSPAKPATRVLFDGITIEANARFIPEDAFIEKITAALKLLKSMSPGHFVLLKTNIGKIKATQASGANFNDDIMTIEIAKRTFDASLSWVTSVLIHETIHIKKFKDTGRKFGDAHKMSDKKAALKVMIDEELECNRYQLEVLQLVGGTKREIDYLRAQKGDHFDIDKDGDYDSDDYNLRNWE